jgi:hypothetical protein
MKGCYATFPSLVTSRMNSTKLILIIELFTYIEAWSWKLIELIAPWEHVHDEQDRGSNS